MNPLVSIIMPAFNVAPYIEEAVDSVIHQDYGNWELIIVDNASTDETWSRIISFKDKRIHAIQEQKRGISTARNAGLKITQGNFICFLDADDRLPPWSISARIQTLLEQPEYDYCDGRVIVWNETFSKNHHEFVPQTKGKIREEMAKLQPSCFAGITWMIRKKNIGSDLFPEDWELMEDRIFFEKLAKKGNYTFVNKVTYEIRRRSKSSSTDLVKMEKYYRRFMNEIQARVFTSEVLLQEKKIFHLLFFKSWLKKLNLVNAAKHALQLIRL